MQGYQVSLRAHYYRLLEYLHKSTPLKRLKFVMMVQLIIIAIKASNEIADCYHGLFV